ncbi:MULTISPECIES: CsbD family protein [Citricoccus]|uniref:CsbD family protein n=1 Tax=Citricoccus muralis TaxID=169134 RepID=A0ABY8H7V8_9MICC|nr:MULTISPECIES: CsbD family protein [Citricoccus]WBL19704.1 CsbD family protein [Citricoccus sp. NR2]WFP16780.1 CsbD family protein [Citricoccus muralis]
MSTGDRFSNSAEEAKGKAKQAFGEATDNDSLKNEGKADEAKGSLKNTFEDLKDNVQDKANEALGKVNDAFKKD